MHGDQSLLHFAPQGCHLHASRPPHYGQHPTRGRKRTRWRHCDLLHLQPLGLWGALHPSGVRQPAQLQLHIPIRRDNPRSGQVWRSGVKGQSGTPPGIRRGPLCDAWKWADSPGRCCGKERGTRHWMRKYLWWVMQQTVYIVWLLLYLLWIKKPNRETKRQSIMGVLLSNLLPRIRGRNSRHSGFLGALVSSCRASRQCCWERSSHTQTQKSWTRVTWLARHFPWGNCFCFVLIF